MTDDIGVYLGCGNMLTAMEAAKMFDCYSLSSVIGRLKKRGMKIVGASRPNLTRNGKHKVYFVRGNNV